VGLLTEIDNSYGTERSISYDVYDEPLTTADANGVSIDRTFDWLGRMTSRSVPGQGTESFGYTARGLTSYTGPNGKTTQYGYDEARRKTSETTPKSEVMHYTYDPAGDLRTLTDGRSKVTVWTNDVEGLVRGKQYQSQTFTNIVYAYDVDGRLTSRTFWLDGSTHHETDYGYDDAGNLLTITYPNSPNVTFTYNEVNRIATMATVGLGTTAFTYDDAENLASEYGLWSYDTVTYSYDSNVPHLRTGMVVSQPSGSWSQTYGYDAADRLHTTAAPAGTFTYMLQRIMRILDPPPGPPEPTKPEIGFHIREEPAPYRVKTRLTRSPSALDANGVCQRRAAPWKRLPAGEIE
jgi:YD repeat-containing protein